MGYLSQKKKEERTNIILKLLLVIIYPAFLFSFVGDGTGFSYYLEAFRFHYYLLAILALIYCIYKQFIFYALAFMFFIIISFMNLGYYSPIFFNSKTDGVREKILYVNSALPSQYNGLFKLAQTNNADFTAINNHKSNKESGDMIFSKKGASREGIIRLSPNGSSCFIETAINEKKVVLISVDFSTINEKEMNTVFDNLSEFIKTQDGPVVIFGDFGIPTWTKTFSNFINSSNLEVKNKIIMGNTKFRFSPLIIPSINVLGYKDMGVYNIQFLPRAGKKKHPIIFELGF